MATRTTATDANLPVPAAAWASEARLFSSVRWLLFLIASLGLAIGSAGLLQIIAILLTLGPDTWWFESFQIALPAVGYLVAAAAGLMFLGLSAATFVRPGLLEGPTASPDRPVFGILPWLTPRRLRRLAGWAVFLTGAPAVAGALVWARLGALWGPLILTPHFWSTEVMLTFSPLLFAAVGASALALGVGAVLTPGDRRALVASPAPARAALPSAGTSAVPLEPGDAVAFVPHDGAPLAAARCPVCGTDVLEQPQCCPRCHTPHHPECWDYAGGCAIFGCAPREGRLSAAPAAFAGLGRAAALWSRVYRAQWGAFCLATLGMLSFVAGHALPNAFSLGAGTLVGSLSFLGTWLWQGGAVLAAVAVLGWLLAIWPEARLRRLLQGHLREPIEPPRGEGRALVERLEVAPADQALHAALGAATALIILLFLVLPLLAWGHPGAWFPEFSTVGRWISLVFGAALPVGVLAAARRRLRHVASIQNRVEASLALAKDKPPALPGGERLR